MIQRKKVIVVGANGNISREIIPLLIKEYEVYSLVRSPPEFAINSVFLKFIEADALSSEPWDEWLTGTHAVISCFGVRPAESEERHLEFIKLLIDKMAQKGVKQFIGFFSHGALETAEGKYVFQQPGFENISRAQIHSQCISALKNSDLHYTAICLWKFKEGHSEVAVEEKTWSECAADSAGVVSFVSSELASGGRKTVFLHNKH